LMRRIFDVGTRLYPSACSRSGAHLVAAMSGWRQQRAAAVGDCAVPSVELCAGRRRRRRRRYHRQVLVPRYGGHRLSVLLYQTDGIVANDSSGPGSGIRGTSCTDGLPGLGARQGAFFGPEFDGVYRAPWLGCANLVSFCPRFCTSCHDICSTSLLFK
jgi:hypothetical protein